MRIIRRYGFGIQSPWAYSLVTNVLFDKSKYYAFDELKDLDSKNAKNNEQIFRIINAIKPCEIIILHDSNNINNAETTKKYIERASKTIRIELIETKNNNIVDTFTNNYPFHRIFSMIYVMTSIHSTSLLPWLTYGHINDKSIIIIEDIKIKNKTLWTQILNEQKATATFDLGKRGIAFFDSKRVKQNYKL